MNKLPKQIKSDDIEVVYRQVTETATIWATCGFISQANKLLEKLWSLNYEHTRNTWLNDEGFQVIWSITNKKPDNIPFKLSDITKIEADHWQSHFQPYWNDNEAYSERIKGKNWEELSGNDLLLAGISLAYNEEASNKASNKNLQLNSLKAIIKYIDTCKPKGNSLMNSLICASILAARNGLTNQAEELLIKWGENYKTYSSNTFISYLIRDSETVKILLTGILAPAFCLTKEKCENDYLEISKALDDRSSKGQSLAYEKLKWKDLLNHISIKAISKPDFEYYENSSKSSLALKPALKVEIEQTEIRLNTKLPLEYKKFLLISNGFLPFSFNPTIMSIDKIDWLKNIDPQLIEIWSNAIGSIDNEFTESFSESLLIGGYQEEQQLLLIPSKKNKNWECWFFANWVPGEIKYPNFRYYMENLLQQLDAEV